MEVIKRDFFTPIKTDFQNIAQVSEAQFIKEVGFAIQQLNVLRDERIKSNQT